MPDMITLALLAVIVAGAVALSRKTRISIIITKDDSTMATIHERLDAIEAKLNSLADPAPFDPSGLQASIDAVAADVAAIKTDLGTEPAPAQ